MFHRLIKWLSVDAQEKECQIFQNNPPRSTCLPPYRDARSLPSTTASRSRGRRSSSNSLLVTQDLGRNQTNRARLRKPNPSNSSNLVPVMLESGRNDQERPTELLNGGDRNARALHDGRGCFLGTRRQLVNLVVGKRSRRGWIPVSKRARKPTVQNFGS